MEQKQNIWFVTLILTAIAGYCDTITFVAADKIFSAHVTGNFIVFAYQIIKGSDTDAWIKLLTFPVFILSVMIAGRIADKVVNKHYLLFFEGLILIAAGILAYLFGYIQNQEITWPIYLVVMMVVFAMGFQNAYGKLFAKDTFGPTTMMTGNVTQISLDLKGLIINGFSNIEYLENFKKGTVTIGGFLAGCILGAYIGKLFGLAGILLPGMAMVICYLYTKSITKENPL
ncbi:YoaK family protein [Pedobacter sp. NJ-S-72]